MPGDEAEPPPYQFVLRDEHRAELRRWDEPQRSARYAFLRGHAIRTPKAPIPGRLKQLRGLFQDHYELRVSRRRRLIYVVDEEVKLVLVDYVGPHPDWRRSRPGRITP